MKIPFIVILLFFFSVSMAQQVEFIVSVNNNNNMFFGDENFSNSLSNYTPKKGFSAKVAFENANDKKLKWRATIGYEKYGGEINISQIGNNTIIEAKIDKSVLSLSYFPINITLWNKLDFNLGMEMLKAVRNDYEGTRKTISSNGSTSTTITTDLNQFNRQFNASYNAGLSGRIAYLFMVSDELAISPQITCYYGLNGEFKQAPLYTKSFRPSFGIGVEWIL